MSFNGNGKSRQCTSTYPIGTVMLGVPANKFGKAAARVFSYLLLYIETDS